MAWGMPLGKRRAGIRLGFVRRATANPGMVLVFLLGLGMFVPSARAQQQPRPAIGLGEEGRPDLTVKFSHLTNVNGRTYFILNVTNIGSGPAAVREKLNGEGVYGGGLTRMTTTAVSPTNAGWTVIPPARSVQIAFDPGWGISFWSDGTIYSVYIPYRDAKDTNTISLEKSRSYQALCDDIPRHAPPLKRTIPGGSTNSNLTDVPTGRG